MELTKEEKERWIEFQHEVDANARRNRAVV